MQYRVNPKNMVEDIEAVRQALDLGKISLLGHSFGGALVQAYAFKYQKNLSHLILGSTFASTKELNRFARREVAPNDSILRSAFGGDFPPVQGNVRAEIAEEHQQGQDDAEMGAVRV